MAVRSLPTYLVDAFSAQPFSGNPAAVCLCEASLPDATRQRIAAEMNQAETAFIEPAAETASAHDVSYRTDQRFRLRWFSPTTEVPLCGHATLAAAAVLMQACGNTSPAISFSTLSGELVVRRQGNAAAAAAVAAATGQGGAAAAAPQPTPAPSTTAAGHASSPPNAAAAGDNSTSNSCVLEMSLPRCDPVDPVPQCGADTAGPLVRACVGELRVSDVRFTARGGIDYLLLSLADGTTREQLESIRPDFAAMSRCATMADVHGVIVCTAGGGSGYDVLSRFFAPWMGIPEDPVTGSAHAVLGPYWARRLGKSRMTMRQCSARGGELFVQVPEGSDRVLVSGAATLVMSGTLQL